MAQTIEGFVGNALDEAKISPTHIKVVALIAAGYFFDVIDLIVLGSLIPDMLQTNFATRAEAAWIGSATVLGMFIGAAGQGEFSDGGAVRRSISSICWSSASSLFSGLLHRLCFG